jgi:hypothetical protein
MKILSRCSLVLNKERFPRTTLLTERMGATIWMAQSYTPIWYGILILFCAFMLILYSSSSSSSRQFGNHQSPPQTPLQDMHGGYIRHKLHPNAIDDTVDPVKLIDFPGETLEVNDRYLS